LVGIGADLEKTRKIVAGLQAEAKIEVEETKQMPMLLDRVGAIGIIAFEQRPLIEVAVDAESLAEMSNIFQAQDGVGYREMLAKGKMLLLPTSTEAKRLVPRNSQGICVRLRSGEHKDKVVWVLENHFHGVELDTEEFPPALYEKEK
jgi:hypothetical protein